MTQSRNAVSNLVARYKAVLKNCHLLNVMAAAALAGAVVLGSAGMAVAEDVDTDAPAADATEPAKPTIATGTLGDDDNFSYTGSGQLTDNTLSYDKDTTTGIISANIASNGELTIAGGDTITMGNKFILNTATKISTTESTKGIGTLVVNGYLTQTATGSDISGVNVVINPAKFTPSTGEAYTEGELALGNDLTVGNVNFANGTGIWVNEAKTTLTIAKDKTVSFADGAYINGIDSASVLLMGEGDIASAGTLTVKKNPVLMTTMKAENIDIVTGGDLTIGQNDSGAPQGAGNLTAKTINNNGTISMDMGSATVGTINNGVAGSAQVGTEATGTKGEDGYKEASADYKEAVAAVPGTINVDGGNLVVNAINNASGNISINKDGNFTVVNGLTVSEHDKFLGDSAALGSGFDLSQLTATDNKLTLAKDQFGGQLTTTTFTVDADVTTLAIATQDATNDQPVAILGDGKQGAFLIGNGLTALAVSDHSTLQLGEVFDDGDLDDISKDLAASLLARKQGGEFAGKVTVDADAALRVNNGNWKLGDVETAGTVSVVLDGNGAATSLTTGNFTQSGGNVKIQNATLTATDYTQDGGAVEIKDATLTVEDFAQTAGAVTVGEDATFKVNGTFANAVSGISIEEDGTLAIAADKLVTATTTPATESTPESTSYAVADGVNAMDVQNGGTVALGFDAGTKLTTDNLAQIKGFIDNDFAGILNIGTAELTIDKNDDTSIDYSTDLGNVTSNSLKDTTVKVTAADATSGISGGFGAVKLAESDSLTVKSGSNLFLSGDGKAIVDKDGNLATTSVAADSALILNGSNQTIGGVSGDGELVVEGSGTTIIKGDVKVEGLELINSTTKIGCVVEIGSESLEMNNSTLSVAYNENGATLADEGSVTVTGDNIEGTGTINTESYFKAEAQHFDNNDSITINAGKLNIVQDATTSEWSKGEDGFDANSGNAIDFAGINMAGDSNLALNALNGNITTGDIEMNGGSLAINAAKGDITAGAVTVKAGSIALNGTVDSIGTTTIKADAEKTAYASINSNVDIAAAVADSGAEDITSVLALGKASTGDHNLQPVTVGDTTTAGAIGKGGMLIADMTNIKAGDTLTNDTTVTFEDGSALRVVGAVLGEEDADKDGLVGTLFGANASINNDDTQFSTDNRLIVIKANEAKDGIVASAADLSTVLPNMDSDLASLVGQAATTQHGNSFLTKALDVNAIADPAAASKAIEGAAKAGHAAGIGAGLQNVQAAGGANIEARQDSFAFNGNDTSNMLAMNGDGTIVPVADKQEGLGIWFMPMYKHSSADGFDSGSYDYGFDTDLYGATLGADYTFASSLRLGLAFNVGTGESDSTGDFDGTENDFDYVGLTAYAGMNFGNLGLYADLGYTASSNDITQNNDLGRLSADSDADLISAGIKADYKIAMNNINLTPYAGIRLNYYSIDGYNTKFYGENVIDTDSSDYTIIEFPVGLTIDTTLNSGDWAITPSAGLGIKFAAGDLDHDQRVSFNGLAGSSTVSSEVADEVTFQGALGLGFAKDAYSIDLGYTLDLSENVESHGVNVNLRYEF